jgi:hypothetical protein
VERFPLRYLENNAFSGDDEWTVWHCLSGNKWTWPKATRSGGAVVVWATYVVFLLRPVLGTAPSYEPFALNSCRHPNSELQFRECSYIHT